MAFKDFSPDDRILSEVADGMRRKDGSRANWPEGSAILKAKMAVLERSCDWIIEKIRAGKMCAYIKSDREMRQLPSHDFVLGLTIHSLRGVLDIIHSDSDTVVAEAGRIFANRKRDGLTGEVWFERKKLVQLRVETPDDWCPIMNRASGSTTAEQEYYTQVRDPEIARRLNEEGLARRDRLFATRKVRIARFR